MNQKRPLAITILCAIQALFTGLSLSLFSLILFFPKKMETLWNWWMKLAGISNETYSLDTIVQIKWPVLFSFGITTLIVFLLIRGLWNMQRWAFILYMISAVLGIGFVIINTFAGRPISFFSLFWNIILLIVLIYSFKQRNKYLQKA